MLQAPWSRACLALAPLCLVFSILFLGAALADSHDGSATDPAQETTVGGDDPPDDPPEPKLTGTIVIMVVIGGDGEDANTPIGGAKVVVTQAGIQHRTTTRSNGTARITGLEYGSVTVRVSMSNFKSRTTGVTIDNASESIELKLVRWLSSG